MRKILLTVFLCFGGFAYADEPSVVVETEQFCIGIPIDKVEHVVTALSDNDGKDISPENAREYVKKLIKIEVSRYEGKKKYEADRKEEKEADNLLLE